METESTFTLPTPSDTPYRTPSSSRSRQTSRTYEDASRLSTPPPLRSIERNASRGSRESSHEASKTALDDNIPLSDPRRFTPTLHASLISEILSLRRDLQSRTKDVDQLEQKLHSAQTQNGTLTDNLLASNKETRSLKRQLQMLEKDTLSAITDLAKERDRTLDDISELRTRFDHSQKEVKTQEATLDHMQIQWDKDKENWMIERRMLETKVRVAEGRIKVVLAELEHAQSDPMEDVQSSPGRPQYYASVVDSPDKRPQSGSSRRQSAISIDSDNFNDRFSVSNYIEQDSTNLADELALNDFDEDDGRVSPDALPEENARPTSSLSLKARKILGLPIELADIGNFDRRPINEPHDKVPWEPGTEEQRTKYVGSADQYSPPSSPNQFQNRSITASPPVGRFIRYSTDEHRGPTTLGRFGSTIAQDGIDTVDTQTESIHKNAPVMVSSACQTIEQLPSPPLTPKSEPLLATIDESVLERVETREIATQTEATIQSIKPVLYVHRHSDTADLKIPTIAIIPPNSRPVTPEEHVVQLPPRTRNAGSQVEVHVLHKYCDTSMQTEEIRIDQRSIIPHPLLPPPPPPSLSHPACKQSKQTSYPRRNQQSIANSSSRRSGISNGLPPVNDDGPLSTDSTSEISRPVRSSSVFAGFDDQSEVEEYLEDDVFHEDEFISRPAAKFVLQRGKLVSHEEGLEDIGESVAINAGENFALENIRMSEDALPHHMKNSLPSGRSSPRLRSLRPNSSSKQVKIAATSSRSSVVRRSAVGFDGAAAHRSKHSQSSMESFEVNHMPPPLPIPLRYSSARVGKTRSEGGRDSRGSNTSPTKGPRRSMRHSLRKARSGPALSPAAQTREARSRSPPPNPRISIVPDLPTFQMPLGNNPPNLVTFDFGDPRSSVTTGPSRASHVKTSSDAVSVHQTSVVDSIAQTMIGEWMYKYVRRRKSFGKPEKDWDPNKSLDELSSNGTTGARHKRWVWLAPYDRCVMWSSKQPTDGISLLGKTGRKLTIKSVLDVKDDNPMPKNSLTGPQFNRSILILTPQRALKFTATNQERHFVWLTALSFLSHSPLGVNELGAIPPIPEDQRTFRSHSPGPSFDGSFQRRPFRDSIRLAKGPHKKALPAFRSYTTDDSLGNTDLDLSTARGVYESIKDAAIPPIIRRYHNRKRSNTAPRALPNTFRTSVTAQGPGSNVSQFGAFFSEREYSERGVYTPTFNSRRGSEASAMGRPNIINSQIFNNRTNSSHPTSMTMRMDAFVDHKAMGRASTRSLQSNYHPIRRNNSGRKDMSYWGLEEVRNSASPVDSLNFMPAEIQTRYNENTGRKLTEREYFRGF